MVFSRRPRQSEIRCTKCHDLIYPRRLRKGNKFTFFAASLPKFNVTVKCADWARAPTLHRRKLKTKVSLSKLIKCSLSHTKLEKFQNATTLDILDLCLRKTRAGKSHPYRGILMLSKFFRPHQKCKTSAFKFLRFEVRFRKVPFSKCFLSQKNASRPF